MVSGQRSSPDDTVIGEGAELSGELEIGHGVRVYGVLEGRRLATPKALIVGERGQVRAEVIQVGEAFIDGTVSGELRASQQVCLGAGAVFRGRLETPRLVLEEGAVLEERPEPSGPGT